MPAKDSLSDQNHLALEKACLKRSRSHKDGVLRFRSGAGGRKSVWTSHLEELYPFVLKKDRGPFCSFNLAFPMSILLRPRVPHPLENGENVRPPTGTGTSWDRTKRLGTPRPSPCHSTCLHPPPSTWRVLQAHVAAHVAVVTMQCVSRRRQEATWTGSTKSKVPLLV